MKRYDIVFEPATLEMLRHFATLNDPLQFRKGSIIRTLAQSKSLVARATLKQDIPRDFAIADLSRFLNAISLFQEPIISLDESSCTIADKRGSMLYGYADERSIRTPGEFKTFKEIFSFRLEASNYAALRKGMTVFAAANPAIVGDGRQLSLQVSDQGNQTSDVFKLVIGVTRKKFKAVIPPQNLKLLPRDYQVTINENGPAYFKAADGSIEYWMAADLGVGAAPARTKVMTSQPA